MTSDEAAKALAEIVRKLVWSPHSGLKHTTRGLLRRAYETYEAACKRRTGFERLLADDGDHLPGSEDATAARPKCKYCGNQFKPRHKNQKWCSSTCRKAAFYERQKRIRHQDTKPAPVLESKPWVTEEPLSDDD